MSRIMCSALIPHSAQKMFILVNDISAYQKFIPGCTASRVIKQNNSALIAEINISKGGISKSFITRNVFVENQSIVIHLIEGPFSSFAGDWRFIPLQDKVSKVEFHLDFEFKNKLIELTFGHILKSMMNNIVMAFTYRANEVYNT